MKKSIKMIGALLTMVFLLSLICISGAAAYDDNYVFLLNVAANEGRTLTAESYYRGATDNTTPWMVNYVVSDEGTQGTLMMFELARKVDTHILNATIWREVAFGAGPKYFPGEVGANQNTVYLAVKNNNNVATVYHIAGYWDEETAAHPFSVIA